MYARDCHCLVIYACVSQPRGQVYIGTIPADADFFLYIFHNGHRFFWNYKFRKHIRLQMKVSIAFTLFIYLPFSLFYTFFSKTFYSHAVQQWPCVPLSQFYKLVSEDTNFIDSDKPITNANIT